MDLYEVVKENMYLIVNIIQFGCCGVMLWKGIAMLKCSIIMRRHHKEIRYVTFASLVLIAGLVCTVLLVLQRIG